MLFLSTNKNLLIQLMFMLNYCQGLINYTDTIDIDLKINILAIRIYLNVYFLSYSYC